MLLVGMTALSAASCTGTRCIGEGELAYAKAHDHCCPGLASLADMGVVGETDASTVTCEWLAPVDVAVCAACGDGECGVGENGCNCPEDCDGGPR